MKQISERRQQIAFGVPVVLVGLVAYLASGAPMVERWLNAAGAGLAVTLGGLLISLFATSVASRLFGAAGGDLERRLADRQALLSGILVAVVVWSWWQIDKRINERDLIECVDSWSLTTGGHPSDSVRGCLRVEVYSDSDF